MSQILRGLSAPIDRSLPGWWLGGLILMATVSGYVVAVADFNALFICISLLACVLIFIDFRIGVALLTIIMPISASSVFPHNIAGITGLNPLNLLLFGTLAAWFLQRSGGGSMAQLAPPPLRWWYVLPMVIGALLGLPHLAEIPSYFRALELVSFDNSLGYLRDMLLKPLFMVLFAVLVGAAMTRSRREESFPLPMLISVWLMCLLTIVFVYLSGATLAELSSSRAREFFLPLGMHANDLGRCYAMAYALMLFTFAASGDFRLRALLMVSMGVVVIALIFTFSRGAFLGFVGVNGLFLLSRRKVVPLLLGGVLLVGLVFLLPDAVFDRLGTGWGNGLNAISAGRVDEIWLPLLPELWNSPVYGHGIGSILWSDALRNGLILQVTHPHNAYLQAAMDLGVVGLILLCAYFVHVWKGFRQLSNDPSLNSAQRGFYEGAAVGLLSLLLAAFAGSSLMPVPEQCFLWLAIGTMYGEQARKSEALRVQS
jgi:O-antigen ligase